MALVDALGRRLNLSSISRCRPPLLLVSVELRVGPRGQSPRGGALTPTDDGLRSSGL
jgi:hypothetical protein